MEQGAPWPQPSRLRSWTDDSGREWRRAGDRPMMLNSARRAFHDDDVTVVHFYGVTPSVIDQTDELWSRIETILRGDRSVSDHADVAVWRFRGPDGRKLLAVEESR